MNKTEAIKKLSKAYRLLREAQQLTEGVIKKCRSEKVSLPAERANGYLWEAGVAIETLGIDLDHMTDLT